MVTLPIDLIPGTNPPKFKWRQIVGTVMGDRVMDYESGVPPTLEPALVELIELVKRQAEDAKKLQAFKDWVHSYLDSQGVPSHPPGSHGSAGCRIGDRMDWLMDQLKLAKEKHEVPQQPPSRKVK